MQKMGSKHNAVIWIFGKNILLHNFFYYFIKNQFRRFFCSHIIGLQMTTKNSHKSIMNFYCEQCDYKCSKNSDFNKHLSTAKHLRTTNDYENVSTHI